MLSRLSSRNISLLVIALSLLLGILWYFMMFAPAQAQAQLYRDEIDQLEASKRIGESARRNITELCAEVGTLTQRRDAFLKALPPTEQLANLLDELRGSVATSGGQLTSVTRTASAPSADLPAGVQSINVGLGESGTFGSFYKSLRAIENLQRFARVETVTLQLSGQATSYNPPLTSTTSMTAFVYDAPALEAGKNAVVTSCKPGGTP